MDRRNKNGAADALRRKFIVLGSGVTKCIGGVCAVALVAGTAGPAAYGQSLSQAVATALAGNCADIGPARGADLAHVCAAGPPVSGADSGGSPSGPADEAGENQESAAKKRLEYLREQKASAAASPTTTQYADASSSETTFDLGALAGFVNFNYQNVSEHQTYFTSGFNSNKYGGDVGADYSFGNYVVGGAFQISGTDGTFQNGGGNFGDTSYGGFVYGSVDPIENMFVDAVFGYARKDMSLDRAVSASNAVAVIANGIATSSTNANEYRGTLSSGYDFNSGSFTYGPRVALNYTETDVDAFAESGSTGLELAFAPETYKSLTSSIGGAVSMAISTSFGVIVPQLTADYIHEFMDNQQTFTAHFVQDLNASPTILSFQNNQPDRNYFGLGVGATLGLPHGFSTFVNYRALVGDELKTTQTVSAGVRMEF